MGYRELLRTNRDFRNLWFAEIVSFLGDWFNTIALYTIVQDMSGSGRAFAGILVGKTLPVFLVAPIVGPLVDRWDRRRLLITSDVVRAVLVGGLILAHRADSIIALYVCHFVMVAVAGVFIPARSAAIPQVTTPEQLGIANALSGGTWSVMLAFGAAIGGWVTAAVGTDASLALDGLTFLGSAAFLLLLPRLPAPGAGAARKDRSFGAGLRHLLRSRRTLALAALKPMMALGGGALLLIPIYGSTMFANRNGPVWMGVLFAARGFGALLGSVVLIRMLGDDGRTLRRVILVMFPLAAISYLMLGRATQFETAVVAVFSAAIGSGAIWVMSGTLLQREGDPQFLGRIFSVEFGVMTLMVSTTSWAAGTALDVLHWTPRQVATASGLLLFVPFVVWGGYLLFERRRIRRPGIEDST